MTASEPERRARASGEAEYDDCEHTWFKQATLYTDKEISKHLGLSPDTVYHVWHCFECHSIRYEASASAQELD